MGKFRGYWRKCAICSSLIPRIWKMFANCIASFVPFVWHQRVGRITFLQGCETKLMVRKFGNPVAMQPRLPKHQCGHLLQGENWFLYDCISCGFFICHHANWTDSSGILDQNVTKLCTSCKKLRVREHNANDATAFCVQPVHGLRVVGMCICVIWTCCGCSKPPPLTPTSPVLWHALALSCR